MGCEISRVVYNCNESYEQKIPLRGSIWWVLQPRSRSGIRTNSVIKRSMEAEVIGAVLVAYISRQKRSCVGTKLGLGALCERRNGKQAVLFTVQMMIPSLRNPRAF